MHYLVYDDCAVVTLVNYVEIYLRELQRPYFEEKRRINWWGTPPENPDLNPMEDLWSELKYYLESKVMPTTKQELVDRIK